jgi:hypothetical protein
MQKHGLWRSVAGAMTASVMFAGSADAFTSGDGKTFKFAFCAKMHDEQNLINSIGPLGSTAWETSCSAITKLARLNADMIEIDREHPGICQFTFSRHEGALETMRRLMGSVCGSSPPK